MPDKQNQGMNLDTELFTPALQQAVGQAQENGFRVMDVVNGAANAYMRLLVMLLGSEERAAEILNSQAEHLLKHAGSTKE